MQVPLVKEVLSLYYLIIRKHSLPRSILCSSCLCSGHIISPVHTLATSQPCASQSWSLSPTDRTASRLLPFRASFQWKTATRWTGYMKWSLPKEFLCATGRNSTQSHHIV